MESIREGSKKALSVFMAVLLAFLMMPLLPADQAVAASDEGLIKEHYFNNHAQANETKYPNTYAQDFTKANFEEPTMNIDALADAVKAKLTDSTDPLYRKLLVQPETVLNKKVVTLKAAFPVESTEGSGGDAPDTPSASSAPAPSEAADPGESGADTTPATEDLDVPVKCYEAVTTSEAIDPAKLKFVFSLAGIEDPESSEESVATIARDADTVANPLRAQITVKSSGETGIKIDPQWACDSATYDVDGTKETKKTATDPNLTGATAGDEDTEFADADEVKYDAVNDEYYVEVEQDDGCKKKGIIKKDAIQTAFPTEPTIEPTQPVKDAAIDDDYLPSSTTLIDYETGFFPCAYSLKTHDLYSGINGVTSNSVEYDKTTTVTAPKNMDNGKFAKLNNATVASGNEAFQVISFDSKTGVATIQAKKVLAAQPGSEPQPDTATLEWEFDNGAKITQDITITVTPRMLNPEQNYPYRVQAEQVPYIAQSVEGKLLDKDKNAYHADCSGLKFDSYPIDGGGSAPVSGAILLKDAKGVATTNYVVKLPAAFNIAKIDSAKAADFDTVKEGTDEKVEHPKSTWVNSYLDVKKGGSTFANGLKDNFVDRLPLQTAEGSYDHQTYYVKNNETKIITRVDDAAYNIDRTAPVVKAFSYPDAAAEYDGTLFFNGKGDVTLAISDDPNAKAAATAPTNQYTGASVSGLVPEGAKVTWHDDHDNADHSTDTLNIDKDSAANGTFRFSVDKDQEVKTSSIKATAKDKAGNVMNADTTDALKIPEDVMRLVSDAAAPVLTMTFDNNDVRHGHYYNANRTVTLTINEAHFQMMQEYDPTQVIATITENGQARYFNPGSFKNVGKDTWQVTYTFNNNSDYTVNAQVSDLIGRKSAAFGDTFTVDKIAPTISVNFDNNSVVNDKYYSAPRTATISVAEHNFSDGLVNVAPTSGAGNGGAVGTAQVQGWSHEGDTHVIRVHFPGEGAYTLDVSGVDLADNAMNEYTCPEFVVDNIDPEIHIQIGGSEVSGATVCPEDATVTVTIDDTNVNGSQCTATLNSIGSNEFGETVNGYNETPGGSDTQYTISYGSPDDNNPSHDGVYTLQVQATDYAGRTSARETVQWSVNRFSSTYVPKAETSEMLDKHYLKASEVKNVEITEVNPSGLNESETKVTLTRGTDNAVLTRDTHYTVSSGDGGGWHTYDYVINSSNFQNDSPYEVTLHSQDVASRVSENTLGDRGKDHSTMPNLSFVVDSTAPICSFLDFEDSTDPQKDVKVSVEDNSVIDHVDAYLSDAGEVDRNANASGQPKGTHIESPEIKAINEALADDASTEAKKAFAENGNTASKLSVPVTIPEANGKQVLTVVAYDKAGNAMQEYSQEILVSSNPLVRWWVNVPLRVGTIVGVIALIGLAVFLVGRKRGWFQRD